MSTKKSTRAGLAVAALAVGATGMIAAPAQAAPVAGVAAPTAASASSARNYYGAIVVNRKTGYMFARNDASSRYWAERSAMSKCKAKGSGKYCTTLVWARNACGAAAEKRYSNGSIRYQGGWGSTRAKAVANAKKPLGKGARYRGYFCTTRYR
ncbi:DUF4189 domain-containing protein [Janibacter sp. GXQ6167]|uniref:DUF4189 domain-containing protein n=1 Tax=Janibacter sp. GXQ6167 TaxID=3240791 RepID=UPI003524B24F